MYVPSYPFCLLFIHSINWSNNSPFVGQNYKLRIVYLILIVVGTCTSNFLYALTKIYCKSLCNCFNSFKGHPHVYSFIFFFRDLLNLILGMMYWTRQVSHLPAGRAGSTSCTSSSTCQNLISMTRVRIVCISISLYQRYTLSCWFVLIVKFEQMSCRFLSCKVTNRWSKTANDLKAMWCTWTLVILMARSIASTIKLT